MDHARPALAEAARLLAGRASRWHNLGLWAPGRDYEGACEALACAVGEAAGLAPGERVLELGSGAGAGLALWRGRFGVLEAVGVELEAGGARDGGPGTRVVVGPALDGLRLAVAGPFDAIVCVDAAYHLGSFEALTRAAWEALRPGGRLALATLTVARAGVVAEVVARAASLPRGAMRSKEQVRATMVRDGWQEVSVVPHDQAVLGGFAAFVAARRRALHLRQRMSSGWWMAEGTAALARWGAAAGALGYVLVSGRRPG